MGLYLNGSDVYVYTNKITGEVFVGGIRAISRATELCEPTIRYWINHSVNGHYENKKLRFQKGFYVKHGNKKIK